MPSADTFDCPPIHAFVWRYLQNSKVSVDPFARNKAWATYTNDLNPNTNAKSHVDAGNFLVSLQSERVMCDLAIFDPPYSPRQITEAYQSIGKRADMQATQNGALYSRVRRALVPILSPDAIVLSFGWNSSGMGQQFGFEIVEILLVCHGGAHNDTICIAEKRLPTLL